MSKTHKIKFRELKVGPVIELDVSWDEDANQWKCERDGVVYAEALMDDFVFDGEKLLFGQFVVAQHRKKGEPSAYDAINEQLIPSTQQ